MATSLPTKADVIIDEGTIYTALARAHAPDDAELDDILAKARTLQGLTLVEAAVLLQARGDQCERVFATAKSVKETIYGARMVLFAPLYTSNI